LVYNNEMKQKTSLWIAAFVAACFLLFTATACKKAAVPVSKPAYQQNPTPSAEESKQQRLIWNLKTLIEPYEHASHNNPKWNDSATAALKEFARARSDVLDTKEPWAEIISTNAAAAVQAGCDDPMVSYLFIKFALDQTNSPKTFLDAYYKVALDIQASSYPTIRKFYVAQRTIDQLFYTYGYATTNNITTQPAFQKVMPLIGQNLLPSLEDKSMPAVEAFEACDATLNSMMGEGIADTNAYIQAYHAMEKPIFENWPDAYSSWLFKGEGYVELAWAARGYGFANTVGDENMRLFAERLAIAENALTNAWQLNPEDSRIADKMLEVELGQGEGRDRLELWFNRAMALNPNDFKACNTKLNYLAPKWYGSTNDMLLFGRECATNKQWGGNVPLILLNAHDSIESEWTSKSEQTNYWKQPEVWSDLNTAYERFFEANPDATGRYYQYAWYAYKCGQWVKFIELIPRLGPVNCDYFSGKDKFDEMVQLAKENINGSPSPEQK
jgi:hypothetical protein